MSWIGPYLKAVRSPGWWRLGMWCVVAALLAPALLAVVFWAAVCWWDYPSHVRAMPPATTWIEDRNGEPLAAFVASDGQWHLRLTENQIGLHLANAIVAVEDGRFFEHAGVDWKAAGAAAWQNITGGRIRRGASTLTMQLHRLRDPASRTFFAKFEQAVRAVQIEQRQEKSSILLEYINRAPFGGNLVGAGAASWRYFGKPCQQLSLSQAALLAGLPQNPSRYRPDRHPEIARQRRDHVLDRMLLCGMISSDQHAQARAEPVNAQWRPLPQMRGRLARADGALPMLVKLAERHPGVRLRTTLDGRVQRTAFEAASEQLSGLHASGVTAIAVVVLDTQTSECLASVSLSETSPDVDLVRRARSTGSIVKPFIYAAAFEAGVINAQSMVSDTPAAWQGYVPNNYDQQFRGAMPASAALAQSRNIPALEVLSRIGVDRALGVMGAAGMKTMAGQAAERYGLSLAIGGAEATPLEVAEAYATLGRGGMYQPSRFVIGEDNPFSKVQCLAPAACWQTMRALSDPQRTASICPEAASKNVAWKTGTSSGHRDAWCAAVTPRRTVVIWMGNADGEGSSALVGAEAAAPLALRLIAAIDEGGSPWPAVDVKEAVPASARQVTPRHELTVLSPSDAAEIVMSGEGPVLLQASAGGSDGATETLWWFVDGESMGAARACDALWWEPRLGDHEIRVVDTRGASAKVRVRVRR